MEYFKWHSPSLGQDMELKTYGSPAGKPVIVFPSGGGRFFEYEDFGMVGALSPLLEEGRIQLFTVDSIDHQSLFNRDKSLAERMRRHEQYEDYVMREVLPFIREKNSSNQSILSTGCSGGGYHAANFLFRHPDVFDSVVSLSGLYGPRFAFQEAWDDSLYFHFPLTYLPRLDDPTLLSRIKSCRIVLCVGLGAWERCADYDCIEDTKAMKEVLTAKDIPAWVDFWGEDAAHDWPWWRLQAPYFFEHVL